MAQTAYRIDYSNALSEQTSISAEMFGGNLVATRNTLVPGGPFDIAVGNLGITGLRYPGGTVTEQFFDPLSDLWDQLFDPPDTDYVTAPTGETIIGPAPVFEYATANELGVTIVLPTSSLLKTNAQGDLIVDPVALNEVQALVAAMLHGKYGDVSIDKFEIGNEYYCYADMTAKEYGMVANELIIAVNEEIMAYAEEKGTPANWEMPEIAIQAGAGWQEGDSEAIIAELDPEARAAVDEIVIHYYPEDFEEVGMKNGIFSQIEIWESAEGFGALDVYASEWNIQTGDDSDTGLAQASSLLAGFDEMLRQGVDSADVWGIQFRYLDSNLSTISDYDSPTAKPGEITTRLTAAGEIFASLSESVIGLMPFNPDLSVLLDNNGKTESIGSSNPDADTIVTAYGSEDKAVIYISSRSSENTSISLNLTDYFGKTTHVWGEVLTTVDDPSTPGTDEGDPLAVGGIPEFDTLTGDELEDGSKIVLEPYEILRVNVQLDGGGVTMRGHDGLDTDPINLDDTFSGSDGQDSIHGFAGDDQLAGYNNHDVVHGGDGYDLIEGGEGDDVTRGGGGNDEIYGSSGTDVVDGDTGDDWLFGSTGNDVLNGGSGDDSLYGGDGNDILTGGTDDDILKGGEGADYYVITGQGDTIITDWSPGDGDKITFLGAFSDAAHLRDQMQTTEGTDASPGDLLITHPDGSTVTIVGGADEADDIHSCVADFTKAGQLALDLTDSLNDMDRQSTEDFIDAMSNEELHKTFLQADPVILFATLEPKAAANLFSSIDSDLAEKLLDGQGDEAFQAFLSDMDDKDYAAFLTGISPVALESVIDQTGLMNHEALAEDAGSETASTLENKLDQTHHADRSSNDEDNDLPWRPVNEADDANEDESDDQDKDHLGRSPECFVATAVYQDGQHPDVWLLRWYRDAVLRRSIIGRLAIVIYWRIGPVLARWTQSRPRTRTLVRSFIAWIVRRISIFYDRKPGLQVDQPEFMTSRDVRVFNWHGSRKDRCDD